LPGASGCAAAARTPGFAADPALSVGAASADADGRAAATGDGIAAAVFTMAGAPGEGVASTVEAGAGSFFENITTPMTMSIARGNTA
jgi:hypothetical protein